MKIARRMQERITQSLTPGKALVLYGPRQVGKTTLVRDIQAASQMRTRYINADELIYHEALSSQDSRVLGDLLGDAELLIIDEAQRVTNIGINLKILVDTFPHASILATVSASFDLANKINEPLTGRKITFTLFPVSYPEIRDTIGVFDARAQLERWLIWGGYPSVATTEQTDLRESQLNELVGSYLYRDILELEGIRRSAKIVDLLRLLALQIGQEVSLAELAANLAMNRQTVEHYLDLLEQVFVIFRVGGFSRNLRKEISKNSRYYFYDNGVRNSLIRNYNPIALRGDVGQLWENFLMIERKKSNQYAGQSVNGYFWRTYDQKEIDYIEESGGRLNGYEFKWQSGDIRNATRTEFQNAYPESELYTVRQDNFEQFLK